MPVSQRRRGRMSGMEKRCADGRLNSGGQKGTEQWGKVEGSITGASVLFIKTSSPRTPYISGANL